jgi:hypothetical protein
MITIDAHKIKYQPKANTFAHKTYHYNGFTLKNNYSDE